MIAFTRDVSPAMDRAELTFLERTPIDLELARAQHGRYRRRLEEFGVRVHLLPSRPDLPDCVFIEDTAVVLDELAVIARPGAPSRRGEVIDVVNALVGLRELAFMRAPATLEGGDVVQVGQTLYVGRSSRTNAEGMSQLQRWVKPHGYRVVGVHLRDCLHLKSACTLVSPDTVLVNPAWIQSDALRGLRTLRVPRSEPGAADVLLVGDAVIVPAEHPRTSALLERAGIRTVSTDVSEFLKAEGAVTCLSLLLRGAA